MKKSIHYIIGLFCLSLGLASCDTEPELFDEGANGAYFDYEYAADFEKTLNFADYIVGTPDTVSVMLDVKLLGYLMDAERTLAVKTKEVEGYDPVGVKVENVVFADKEYEKQVEIKVKRPDVEDKTYAVCIYLDGSGDIGTGISGKTEVILYVTESYAKPSVWYSHMDTYLGDWSKEKHKFLANLTNDNQFYAKLYDNVRDLHEFDSIVALNVNAVNTLLASEPTDPIAVEFPIVAENDHPDYTEPYFWSEYEEHLGIFWADKFCRFTTMLGGSNTCDIAALYATEEGVEKMKAEAANFHKLDVLEMLNRYYNYALTGTPIAEYKNLWWVEIKNNVNYSVRIPFWWNDPNGLGTAEIVKNYFGEYNDEKYQFMLKTMLKEDGAGNFIAESIFPFVYDKETGNWNWDSSLFGTKQLSGEARLKECYRVIKAANDKRPESRRYDIPDVALD